jgi:hypothetical protein
MLAMTLRLESRTWQNHLEAIRRRDLRPGRTGKKLIYRSANNYELPICKSRPGDRHFYVF